MPRKYTTEERQRALEAVRQAARQGIPASVVARQIGLNARTVQYWATSDRTTYQARLSAIHSGLRFTRDNPENGRARLMSIFLRRLSLYRQEHGITLRPTPWPADDPRRRENKARAKSKG